MDNLSNNMLEAAKKEQKFTASDLITEISALLPDYFVCAQAVNKNTTSLRFYNGQNFVLTVEER